ncbi:hypothetical protein BDR07DRAFT_1379257 [Suillus spraguei]|nr:hypothetical protein BDR07DRAFT_1379257 [Suillus spraguei]
MEKSLEVHLRYTLGFGSDTPGISKLGAGAGAVTNYLNVQTTCTRMHRALAITELLSHIFCEVCNDDEGLNLCRGIKDMARVSQVCKTFRDPALDFLWRNLDSLLPLLRLLPLEIHEEHSDKLSKVVSSARY